MSDNKALFEAVPVSRALARLAIPTIISQLIIMVYNLADTFFIGSTQDPYKVAAATLAYTLFFILNALSNLFGIGGGTLISRLLGDNKPEEAKKVCAFSFYGSIAVALLYALLYALLCLVFMEPLLNLLGASPYTLDYAAGYTFWVVVMGGLPAMLSLTMSHLLRSEGYAGQASFGLGMGGVLNIVLDPLFMFVLLPPGREVTGAAMATMVSNTAALCYFGVVFFRLRKSAVISVSPRGILSGARYAGVIFSVGFPSAIGNLLSCAANMVINKLASGYGDIPVAALGVVKKIEMLPMNVGMGLCQGMLPLVAYNYAAQNFRRMKEAVKKASLSGMGFALLCVLVFELFAQTSIRVFIDDADTVAMGAVFLRINCLATPLMICNFHISFLFQAVGKGPPVPGALLLPHRSHPHPPALRDERPGGPIRPGLDPGDLRRCHPGHRAGALPGIPPLRQPPGAGCLTAKKKKDRELSRSFFLFLFAGKNRLHRHIPGQTGDCHDAHGGGRDADEGGAAAQKGKLGHHGAHHDPRPGAPVGHSGVPLSHREALTFPLPPEKADAQKGRDPRAGHGVGPGEQGDNGGGIDSADRGGHADDHHGRLGVLYQPAVAGFR